MKFCRRLRFFLLQHFNRNANVVVDGIPNIHKDADVEVGKNTWIGSNVTILKGVTIGEHCVIASGVIVTKDVPANTVLIQKRINTEYSL